MRAVGKEIRPGHAAEEGVNLACVQGISGLDRGLAGHGGQDIIEDGTSFLLLSSTAESFQDVDKEFSGVALTGHGGNGRDDKGITAKLPDRKTHLSDLRCILFHAFSLPDGEVDGRREKQGLTGDVSLHELTSQLLKEKAFMGGMLVHHQKPAAC